MRSFLSLAIVLAFSFNLVAQDKKFDVAKILGEWTLTSGKKGGEESAKDALKATVTWEKDKVIIASEMGKFVMSFKIDDKSNPAKIDMKIEEGPVKDIAAKGIIALEGEELKLCYTQEGDAPKKFESTKENGAYLFIMKKKAAK